MILVVRYLFLFFHSFTFFHVLILNGSNVCITARFQTHFFKSYIFIYLSFRYFRGFVFIEIIVVKWCFFYLLAQLSSISQFLINHGFIRVSIFRASILF